VALYALAVLMPALLAPRAALASAGAPSLEYVRAEAARGGYRLIDLAGLRERLERDPGRILLFDTRQDWEYRTGHIPGAINFSFEPTRWSRLKNRGALREALGADKSRPLVFY
jgi:3-mercaptopyruvate sulfurtransferase SseA